jgi:TonB family protein
MVVLELTIGRRGRVMEVELRESSGHEPLDAAAMRAVGLWRFPRRNEGSRSLHHFEFRLE